MSEKANTDRQNRLKSWPLWVAIAALITFVAKEVAGVDISETMDALLNLLLPILVGFGIVNNPTSKKSV